MNGLLLLKHPSLCKSPLSIQDQYANCFAILGSGIDQVSTRNHSLSLFSELLLLDGMLFGLLSDRD